LTDLAALWPQLRELTPQNLEPIASALETLDVATLTTRQDLPPALRVIGLWNRVLESSALVWPQLDFESRILALYRAASEGVTLDISLLDEPHGLTLAAALIYSADIGDKSVLEGADRAASRVIIEHGWVESDPPSLEKLVPNCSVPESGVRYCEGRPFAQDDDIAWCPRLREPCDRQNGSHIVAETDLPWWRWSLLELLDSRSVGPHLRGNTTWPNDLAGWINRWYDIRDRLRCSTCGEIMEPNYRYSRRIDAAYGKTVMTCPTGAPGHDRDVYLNHCRGRGCSDPIDSRECSQRQDGFYLCLRCGSGPEGLEPGAMRPRCGSERMSSLGDNRWVKCMDCDHKVHTPPRFG
jgi:hypothetical protein